MTKTEAIHRSECSRRDTNAFISKVTQGSAWFARRAQAAGGARILALDPGYRLGWAVIKLPEKRIEAAGFTDLDQKNLYLHAHDITAELAAVYQATAIVFEQYFVGGGAFAGDSIEMRGAMKYCAAKNNILWGNAPVARVRSMLGLRGKRTDKMVREAVLALMPDLPTHYSPADTRRLKFYPADTWDACAIAWSADTVEGI